MRVPFPRHSRNSLICLLIAACLVSAAPVNAAISYLTLQGSFNGTTLDTTRWAVEYDAGALVTSSDLLAAVFGPKTEDPDTGIFTTSYKGFALEFGFGGDFLLSVSKNGSSPLSENFFNEGWANYSALGGYSYVAQRYVQDENGDWVPYVDGNGDFVYDTYQDTYGSSWTPSQSGYAGRNLADGSFDALIFGEYNPSTYSPLNPLTGTPTAADYSGAVLDSWTGTTAGGNYTVRMLASVPEPGRSMYLLAGGLLLTLRRKRRSAVG